MICVRGLCPRADRTSRTSADADAGYHHGLDVEEWVESRGA